MAEAPRPLTGHCLCGNVRYSADAEPVVQAMCHCTDCQRQTSSPFSAVVGVPLASFEVEGDSLTTFNTVSGDTGGETQRNFCSNCGTPIYSLSASAPEMVFLKAGSLDDSSWLQPVVEVWTSSAQPWTPRIEGMAQFERGPQA
jgi:hypothetical protein